MIKEAEDALRENGKFIKAYHMDLFDKANERCASATNEIYIRNLDFKKTTG
jgi:hypothetical protein